MATVKCYRCKTEYDANNDPDALEGYGRCAPCEQLAKQIAFKVDIEMAEKRRNTPAHVPMLDQLLGDGAAQGFAVDLAGRMAGSSKPVSLAQLGIDKKD